MEGADSDADGNTNATYEVLTTTRAIYSEKNSGNNSQKNQQQKTATPKESEDIYRGAGQRHRPEMCSQQSMEDYITVVLLWLHQGELTIANPRNC